MRHEGSRFGMLINDVCAPSMMTPCALFVGFLFHLSYGRRRLKYEAKVRAAANPTLDGTPNTGSKRHGKKRRLFLYKLRKILSRFQLARARHRPPPDSEQQPDGAQRVTLMAVAVNLSLAVLKLIGGVIGTSAALVADAGHSFSDLISDGITLWAVRMARLPPDEDHPYGHGKFEAVGAFGVSILVISAGVGIGVQSCTLLRSLACETCATAIPSTGLPGVLALAVCMISIVSKEFLYRATDLVGRRLKSPVLQANAKHHRSDVWSSVVALVGVAGSWFGIRCLDPIAALGVAIMVFRMGADVAVDALGQLTDTTDDSIVSAVKRAAAKVSGTAGVKNVRARAMGSTWLAEVEVLPDEFVQSASAADHLAARVQCAVRAAVPDASECLVRVNTGNFGCEAMARMPTPREIDVQVKQLLKALPEIHATTRTMTHFLDGAPSVEVWIKVSPEHSIGECTQIAERARSVLLAGESSLVSAQVHLALA